MILVPDKTGFITSITFIGLSFLSFILNSLTIYILTRKRFLKESIFRYFLVNQFIIILIIPILWMHFIPLLTNWDIPLIYCQFHAISVYIMYGLYPWISVLNSIDRFFSLRFPGRFKFKNQLKYQLLAVFLLFVSSTLINIPRFIYVGFSNVTVCYLNDFQIGFYMSVSNVILSNLIPVLIMLLSTTLNLHYMINQTKRLQQRLLNYHREKDFVKSILTMDLWFFFCFAPLSFSDLYEFVYGSLDKINENNLQIFKTVTQILIFIGNGFNFFVYFSCNKQFRKYFLSMICRRRNISNMRQVTL
jgi:hypothetical protein